MVVVVICLHAFAEKLLQSSRSLFTCWTGSCKSVLSLRTGPFVEEKCGIGWDEAPAQAQCEWKMTKIELKIQNKQNTDLRKKLQTPIPSLDLMRNSSLWKENRLWTRHRIKCFWYTITTCSYRNIYRSCNSSFSRNFLKQLELCTSFTSIMQKKKVAAALTPHTGTENV